MREKISALSHAFTRYLIIGIAICLVSWLATLLFYLTDVVSSVGPVFFVWQLVYYGAPAVCGVLVAFWLVGRLWIRSSPPPPDGPHDGESSDDGPSDD